MTRRLLAAVTATIALLGACSDDTAPLSEPSPSPTLSFSPSPSPEQAELARLAGLAATARYDAVYDFVAPATKDSGSLRIVAAPPYFRLDVATSGSTAVFIVAPTRTISCSIKGTKKSCFLVARKGEAVPDLFDPGIQRLFSDAVRDLAANPLHYNVSQAETIPLPKEVPASTCFRVERAPLAPTAPTPTGFESGRYCFAASGVLTALEVTTGRITMKRPLPRPALTAFSPPAPVATLPPLPASSATPRPSPTPSPTSS